MKRRNLNPVIVPDDVDCFNEISEAQILSFCSKIPEIFQHFLSEESFSEHGKNIFKCTFKNLASRPMFITIFLLRPVFFKKVRKFIMENYNYKKSY